jgi:hypothetical protein
MSVTFTEQYCRLIIQDAHERPHLKEKKEIHVQTIHNSYALHFKVT